MSRDFLSKRGTGTILVALLAGATVAVAPIAMTLRMVATIGGAYAAIETISIAPDWLDSTLDLGNNGYATKRAGMYWNRDRSLIALDTGSFRGAGLGDRDNDSQLLNGSESAIQGANA